VLESHVRVTTPDLCDHLPPQARGLENVRLVYRSDQAAAGQRAFERDLRNSLDLSTRVPHCVERRLSIISHATGFTVIDAAGQFPNDEQVSAGHELGLESATILKPRPHFRRPEVREHTKRLTQL